MPANIWTLFGVARIPPQVSLLITFSVAPRYLHLFFLTMLNLHPGHRHRLRHHHNLSPTQSLGGVIHLIGLGHLHQ